MTKYKIEIQTARNGEKFYYVKYRKGWFDWHYIVFTDFRVLHKLELKYPDFNYRPPSVYTEANQGKANFESLTNAKLYIDASLEYEEEQKQHDIVKTEVIKHY